MIGLVAAMVVAVLPTATPPVAKPTKPCPQLPIMMTSNRSPSLDLFGKSRATGLDTALDRTQGGCPLPLLVRYQVSL